MTCKSMEILQNTREMAYTVKLIGSTTHNDFAGWLSNIMTWKRKTEVAEPKGQ